MSAKEIYTKEEVKKYIIEHIDWLLMLDTSDWGKNNGYFIVEKMRLHGGNNEK